MRGRFVGHGETAPFLFAFDWRKCKLFSTTKTGNFRKLWPLPFGWFEVLTENDAFFSLHYQYFSPSTTAGAESDLNKWCPARRKSPILAAHTNWPRQCMPGTAYRKIWLCSSGCCREKITYCPHDLLLWEQDTIAVQLLKRYLSLLTWWSMGVRSCSMLTCFRHLVDKLLSVVKKNISH